LSDVRALQATVGANAADLVLKAAAKRRLDASMAPLRLLAHAWSGAVMLGVREADDEWQALARAVAANGAWPESLTERQDAMLEAGCRTLSWDLTFPEVFWADGMAGFDAVLSNPPWDIIQPNTAEFLAGLDLSILDATTRREAHAIQHRVLADNTTARTFRDYQETFSRQHRLVDRLYIHQKLGAHGAAMGGKLDLYRVFAERVVGLAGAQGAIGMVVPSAFHANEGATGIRQFYLQGTRLDWCLSFENRRKLFEIHASFKFALIVAWRPGPTKIVRCAFYLADFAQMEEPARLMQYDRAFITASGGAYATLLELRDAADVAMARRLFTAGQRFGAWAEGLGIFLSREIHMTDDAGRFTPINDLVGTGHRVKTSTIAEELRRKSCVVLHEGKTIHQFSDHWDTPPRYAIALHDLAGKPLSIVNTQYYRAACREIARSTDERTVIAAMLPPGVVCGHTISVERRPARRSNAASLCLIGVMNSFPFDWMLRQKAAAHVSLYILSDLPSPRLSPDAELFLAHAALRLSCNHRGFLALWREQLGPRVSPHSWPVIAGDENRWKLRAAMDAIVAHAYGLNRVDYQRILSSFSHKSFQSAPTLCLTAFDELAATGLAAFCRKHDPYCDIPLVTALALPAITLPAALNQQRSLLPLSAR
jgi:hypothetical protein